MNRALLYRLDISLFSLLTFFLLAVVAVSGMANLQTDAIDYYSMVQRLVGDTPPIVPNLPFVEQRSPGYPLLTLPAYYVIKLTTFWVTPQTVRAEMPSGESVASERVLLPPEPLFFREIFFKDFDLSPQDTWFKWHIIAAMLFTGYGFFFVGLFISGKTLTLLYPAPIGFSLTPLIVVTSMVFMHNLVQTPAYATLTVFGISCLLTYFWVQGWQSPSMRMQWAAGLFAGLMVLTRLETILIVAVLLGALGFMRDVRFARNFILGGLLPLALLLFYNFTQFGNPFYTGILKGDMNQIALDMFYVVSVLGRPQSGILFYSTLTSLGILGLFFTKSKSPKVLGWASLVLIASIAVRVPVMYFCVGQGLHSIGEVSITCPPDNSSMLDLIRFDSNRYIIPLVPFAVIGLRGLIENVTTALGARNLLRKQVN